MPVCHARPPSEQGVGGHGDSKFRRTLKIFLLRVQRHVKVPAGSAVRKDLEREQFTDSEGVTHSCVFRDLGAPGEVDQDDEFTRYVLRGRHR